MITATILKGFLHTKLGTTVAWIVPVFTTVAVTEAFYGQLIIALIAAIPPTATVLITLVALKRGQATTQKAQKEMATALDGKLTELMTAKGEVQHAAGVQQERVEERERVASHAPPVTGADPIAAKVEIVNPKGRPVPTEAVNPPPTRQVKE